MKLPLVSILVVTYNSNEYIKNCIEAILKINYPHFEVVVVDNNSTDNTRDIVASFKDKKIKLVLSDSNLGYAAGNNLAAKNASGNYLCILNPDTQVTKDALTHLVKVIEEDKKIAGVQPLIKLLNDKDAINLTGKITNYVGFDWIRDYLKKEIPPSDQIYSFSGAAILLDKKTFDEFGGYDEKYFMYYEDSDLSWKINLIGKKIIYSAEAVVYHDYKYIPKESYQPLKQKIFFYERNRLMTLLKNYSLRTLLLLFPMLIFIEFSMLALSLIQGWLFVKIRTYISLFSLKEHIGKERKKIARERVLSDKQITNHFVDIIAFERFNNPVVTYIINPLLIVYWRIVRIFI